MREKIERRAAEQTARQKHSRCTVALRHTALKAV